MAWLPICGLNTASESLKVWWVLPVCQRMGVMLYMILFVFTRILWGKHYYFHFTNEKNEAENLKTIQKVKWQGLDQNPGRPNSRFQVLNHWALPLPALTQSIPLEGFFTGLGQLATLLFLLIALILEESSLYSYMITLSGSQNYFQTPCYFGPLLWD